MSSYYGYQYKRQCYIPAGTKCPPPAFPQQCHPPGVLKCVQCPPCAPHTGAKVCSVRKSLQSPPCSPGCVESHVVEGHQSSTSSSSSSCCCCCCGPRSPNPCPTTFPQPQGQGRGQLCVSQGVRGCPQVVCAPAPLYPHGSHPYSSYQWSNSYQYNCGQQ